MFVLIVLGLTAVVAVFVVVWIVNPEFRRWIEQPKFRMLEQERRFDTDRKKSVPITRQAEEGRSLDG